MKTAKLSVYGNIAVVWKLRLYGNCGCMDIAVVWKYCGCMYIAKMLTVQSVSYPVHDTHFLYHHWVRRTSHRSDNWRSTNLVQRQASYPLDNSHSNTSRHPEMLGNKVKSTSKFARFFCRILHEQIFSFPDKCTVSASLVYHTPLLKHSIF